MQQQLRKNKYFSSRKYSSNIKYYKNCIDQACSRPLISFSVYIWEQSTEIVKTISFW